MLSRALDHSVRRISENESQESWKKLRMPSCRDTVENKRENKNLQDVTGSCSLKSPAVIESSHIVQQSELVEDLRA